jgi:gamma-glutamyltranspeptidase
MTADYFIAYLTVLTVWFSLFAAMDDFGKPDQANHFGLRPSEANFVKPGKRPLSSMSPMLVFQESTNASLTFPGQLILALGASGGPKIITAVTQVFLNHVIMGLPLLQSVVQPRLHDQLIYHNAAVTNTENVQLDSVSFDISQRTRDALTTRGHSLLDVDYMGTVQAISIDTETGKLSAACDPRKGGSPAGY